jgi:biopolymer transport protein ExbD
MRAADPTPLQSAINVTPLVDVVLVLLIVFMLVAPRMSAGPAIELPETAAPPGTEAHERQLVVAIDADGGLWVDGVPADSERLGRRVREAAAGGEPLVVIHGDARSSFGAVRRAMLEIEAAGSHDVRLVTERAAVPGV